MLRCLEQLADAQESTQHTMAQLRQALDEQATRLDTLLARVDQSAIRQSGPINADSARGTAIPTLMRNLEALRSASLTHGMADRQRSRQYQQTIHRIRGLVRAVVPRDATVVVISRGDDELLQLGCQQAWHFPRAESGLYAGYYPANSGQAIAHLEALRANGGTHLLLPSTALWWLEHYDGFRQHLESRYRIVLRQDDVCVIFALQAE
jgi:hypothetical protein